MGPARQAPAALLLAGAHLTVQIARRPAVPPSIALEAHDNKQPGPLCLPKAHQAMPPCWPLLMPIAPADADAAATPAREPQCSLLILLV